MTVVAGLVAPDGTVYLGADSAVANDRRLSVSREPKIFHNGELLIGYCGSVRAGQVLRQMFAPPPIRGGLMRYMVGPFVAAMRETLISHSCADVVLAGDEPVSPGWLLVGVRGRLFHICADYQVGESRQRYHTIGTGGAWALGALYATQDAVDPVRRLTQALAAAEAFTANVRRPFTVRQLVAPRYLREVS